MKRPTFDDLNEAREDYMRAQECADGLEFDYQDKLKAAGFDGTYLPPFEDALREQCKEKGIEDA